MKNVLIVEDHDEIRNGFRYLISSSSEFSCCGVASDGKTALKILESVHCDVVLMDINLPVMDGITCTRNIKKLYPNLPVMIITVYEDDEKIFNALSAGASGYILKKSSPTQLMEAISDLLNGGSPISSQIARKLVNYFRQQTPEKIANEQLTLREQEILKMLAGGFRNKEIADKICLSLQTVKTHIYNIYHKLHVANRIEAVNKFRGMS